MTALPVTLDDIAAARARIAASTSACAGSVATISLPQRRWGTPRPAA